MQGTIEEYETGLEELKSANEELVSLNEELQSSNEELESTKEELQSLNEELQTVNHELYAKIEDLDRANADLTNLFASTNVATIFLDRNLVIRSFTPAITPIVQYPPHRQGPPLGRPRDQARLSRPFKPISPPSLKTGRRSSSAFIRIKPTRPIISLA